MYFTIRSAAGFAAILLLLYSFTASAQNNPLVKYHPVWNDAKYEACNTAKHVSYMNPVEKEVIFILNMMRAYPKQFLNTIVLKWPEIMERPQLKFSTYFTSLVEDMKPLESLPILQPDSLLWLSARCHAVSSGNNGYVGHDRLTKECEKLQRYAGECCSYGTRNSVELIVRLLIDENVPGYGHRYICLRPAYSRIGVSAQPHKTYGVNVVLDFGW